MSEKKKISIESIGMTTLILFLICVVITFALAGTNFITQGKIAELEAENQKSSMALVLKADDYKENALNYTDKNGTENSAVYYTAVLNGEEIGYIFNTSSKGYGGDINVMTGIDKEGKITAVKILSADDETPGLGGNVTKNNFYSQFAGKTKDFELVKNSATADNQVIAVTGATISSTAVKTAVKNAFELYELLPMEQPEEQPDEQIESVDEEQTEETDVSEEGEAE